MIHIVFNTTEIPSVNKLATNKRWVAQNMKKRLKQNLEDQEITSGLNPVDSNDIPLHAIFVITVPNKIKRDVDNLLIKYYLDYLVDKEVLPEDNFTIIPVITKVCRYEKGVSKVEIYFLNESEFESESARIIKTSVSIE